MTKIRYVLIKRFGGPTGPRSAAPTREEVFRIYQSRQAAERAHEREGGFRIATTYRTDLRVGDSVTPDEDPIK